MVIIQRMYIGYYPSSVTTKMQVTFPKKFGRELGSTLLITGWFEKSLIILPFATGEEIFTRLIENSSALLPEVRDMERFFYSNAVKVQLDEQNRFVLPKHLREYAHIGKRAVFIGVKERIELWDSEMWANYGKIHEEQIRRTAQALYEQITLQKGKQNE